MRKVLFSLLAVVAIMTSCSGISALDYNNKVIEVQTAIVQEANKFNSKIQAATAARDFSTLKAEADSSIAVIDAQIAKLKEIDPPSGGEEFKEAAVKAFESYKVIFEKGASAATFTEETTPEEINKFIKELTEAGQESDKLEDAARAAQKEFAEKNGIKVY